MMISLAQSSSKKRIMAVRSRFPFGEVVGNPNSATIAKSVKISGIQNVHQASCKLSAMCAPQFVQRV